MCKANTITGIYFVSLSDTKQPVRQNSFKSSVTVSQTVKNYKQWSYWYVQVIFITFHMRSLNFRTTIF